jgi:hypothetical protein
MERAATLPIIAAMWRELLPVAPGAELKFVSPLDVVIAGGTSSDDPELELLSEPKEVVELKLEPELNLELEGLVMPLEILEVVPGLMELVGDGVIVVGAGALVDAGPAVTMAK